MAQTIRFETLGKDNYDTWKLFMEALLVKNDLWLYVNSVKPDLMEGNAASVNAIREWEKNDAKARSDIILSISSSELKQIKGCKTAKEVWSKLEDTYQSKGPARKAALLKRLTTHKMQSGSDIQEHLRSFFDTVDKINEIGVEIDADLLSIMLLSSLSNDFENFRCAIESRDVLPSPEALRIKIVEEADARQNITNDSTSNVLYTGKRWKKFQQKSKDTTSESGKSGAFKFKCYKCHVFGHKASECKNKKQQLARSTKDVSMFTSEVFVASEIGCSGSWCLDSGATSHFCRDIRSFKENLKVKQEKLNLANKDTINIVAEGTATFNTSINDEMKHISLKNTQYVPDLRINLLSVGKITAQGFKVIFDSEKAVVIHPDGDVILIANKTNGLYIAHDVQEGVHVTDENSGTRIEEWHKRFGHLNYGDLQKAIRQGRVKGANLEGPTNMEDCTVCLEGKVVRNPFPMKSSRTLQVMDLVHTDLCGPMREDSLGGAKYFIQFIDDCSRWSEVHFLKSKSDTFQAVKNFVNLMENQTGRKLKCIQSDNGKEFVNKTLDEFLRERGIIRRLTIPYNPQQNGIAERRNRTLVEMARCLLLQSGLSHKFWAEAVNAANYIRNRSPTKALDGKTPFEVLTGKIPDVTHLRVFGSAVFILNKDPNIGKFDSRGMPGIFVGYADSSKGYRIWLPNEHKTVFSRDVTFIKSDKHEGVKENEFTMPKSNKLDLTYLNDSISGRDVEIIQQIPEQDAADEVPGPSSGRGRPKIIRTGQRGRPRKEYQVREEEATFLKNEEIFLSEIPMKEAMSSPESHEWKRAMVDELKSIIKNDTWNLVKRPEDSTVIGCRMILRNKLNPDGTIQRRKARLVAQGFNQQPGIHFNETFAPVTRLGSVRLMISLAARYKMKIQQLDVTTAYLNGFLEEDVYMETPKYLDELLEIIIQTDRDKIMVGKAKSMLQDLGSEGRVCLLKKALYGLRQAGRCWYRRFDQVLRKCHAVPTFADPCFYHIGKGENMLLIAVYVDDVLIASRDQKAINNIVKDISQHFDIKNLGEVSYCLGIEFSREGSAITMRQGGYIDEILKKFKMEECNTVSTPMDLSTKLDQETTERSEVEQNLPYREIMGCLTYLATSTRPDIAFVASYLSQFNACYGEAHWKAAKRVLRYLKGTKDIGLVYKGDSENLRGFVDSDWGNCHIDRRSYSGFVFMLNGCAITWDSRKQRTVALSTCEAEYMALTEGAKEALFLQRFLNELGFPDLGNVTIFSDNLGSIKLAENPVFHNRSKHIDIRYHYIRNLLKEGKLKIEHVSTTDMVADVMTKGLPKSTHLKCIKMSGLCRTGHSNRTRFEGEC